MDVGNFVCCGSYWLWEFCIGPLFSNLFLVQDHHDKMRGGCSTLITVLYSVDICVPCPFLKVQWASQESVIVAFPSHVHLEKEDVCWQSR